MTAANADRCIANTLVYEGGFTLHRGDPGNWTGGKVGVGELKGTNFGIAANTYPTLDIPNLTKAQAIAIYKRDYWAKCAGDALPKGIDQVTYDATVNSGPGRGVPLTGAVVGCQAPTSAGAVARAAQAIPIHLRADAVKKIVAKRVAFLRGLSTFSTFGTGWMKRCMQVEAIGVKMVLEDQGLSPLDQQKKLETEARTAKKKRDGSGTAAGGAATTGGGTAATQADPTAWDWQTWLNAGLLTLLVVGLVGFLAWQVWKNQERMKSYIAAARGLIGG